MPLPWPSAEEVVALPVDELAIRILWRLVDAPDAPNRINFVSQVVQEARGHVGHASVQALNEERELTFALSEAWDWLVAHGLLARDPRQTGGREFFFITRLGREIARDESAVPRLRAARRLDVDLHPRLASRVPRQFLSGEFEAAGFLAMREVEIVVRDLSDAAESDYGVELMRQAFKPGGALADPSLHASEQEAMMALFWGAIGLFKNPTSHREIEFGSPTEAAEVILFADLLLRLLDRIAERLSDES